MHSEPPVTNTSRQLDVALMTTASSSARGYRQTQTRETKAACIQASNNPGSTIKSVPLTTKSDENIIDKKKQMER